MRLGEFKRFDMIIDLHRHHAGLVRDIATDHQHHAEFADGVRKTHHRRRNKARPGEWQGDGEKSIHWRGAQRGGDFQRPLADGLEGVVHGAGYGKSGRFDTRPWDNIERVLAGKLDGTVGLMALTLHDPIRYWIGFGSISGRFGGNGLADYAAANDMLAKLVDWYAGQRPDCAACCFHWQSWDEIGMAMLGDSSAGTKQTLKMEFLSPREGVEHFCREIEAGLPLRETLITDGFFERTFYAAAAAPTVPSDQTTGLRAATRGERRGPAGTMHPCPYGSTCHCRPASAVRVPMHPCPYGSTCHCRPACPQCRTMHRCP